MSEILFLTNVRLSFPHLVEPQKRVNEQTGQERISYSADFILAPNDPAFSKFMQIYTGMANSKWKEHAQQVMAMIQADRKSRCYGQGSEKVNKKTFQPYDGYKDNVFISASRDAPPQMIQADGSPVDPSNTMAYQQLARKMYGGCRVNAAVKPWLQENKHGRGIRCDLVAVQFANDDKPFGEAAPDVSGLFGAVVAPAASAMPAAPFAGLPPFLTGQ